MCVCVFRCDGVPRSLSLLDASAMAVPLLPLCSLFPPPVLSTAGPSKKGQHNCQNRKRTKPTPILPTPTQTQYKKICCRAHMDECAKMSSFPSTIRQASLARDTTKPEREKERHTQRERE